MSRPRTLTERLATVTGWLVDNGYVDAYDIHVDTTAEVFVEMSIEDLRLLAELTGRPVEKTTDNDGRDDLLDVYFTVEDVPVNAYAIEAE